MDDTLLLILLVVAALLVMIFVPRWLMKRAFAKVIQTFREQNAINEKNAKTIDELGLTPKAMLERMWQRRDYKPRALQLLMSANIVQMTEDGKLYLSEENLMATKWNKY